MKLVRYGNPGKEKPGLLDAEGKLRDLSGVVKDIGPEQLSADALARLSRQKTDKLPLVKGSPRMGCPINGVGKFIAIGLNYADHAAESNLPVPAEPVVFMKATTSISGPNDDVMQPRSSTKLDWEVELAVVIGTTVRRASTKQAEEAIAGFSVLNDITCRDWQFRTREWLQGKNWDSTTPVGPYLVTPDELPGGVRPKVDVSLSVDGAVMQSDNTGDLLFDPVYLVEYISTMIRLNPGDIIATGTPGGVGHARKPEVYLHGGEFVVAEIAGIGALANHVRADAS